MVDPNIQKELLVALDNLPEEAQRELAEFARILTARQSSGSGTRLLLRLGGSIDPQDLRRMEEAIQEGCEKVEADEW
jgi:hypothetical protein